MNIETSAKKMADVLGEAVVKLLRGRSKSLFRLRWQSVYGR